MNELASHWLLDPALAFLNHGSYGACPRVVLAEQQRWRERLEHDPVHFFTRLYQPALDEARAALGRFVGADARDLAFVPNATYGVNDVLGSFALAPGDELLTTSHAYNACANALHATAERSAARVVVAELPFPCAGSGEVTEAVLAAVTPKTRLVLIDHVTSASALVLPVAELTRALEARGVAVLIDGAHAAGMLPLDLGALGASYYTANCHKWMCAPKGAAFLWVRRDRQPGMRPLVVSHGRNARLVDDRSRFQVELDWTGTHDPCAYLCVPTAITAMAALTGIADVDAAWQHIRQHNHARCLAGRATLCKRLGLTPPAPDDMLGSMATLPVWPLAEASAEADARDPLAEALYARHAIEVPVFAFPRPPTRWLRISAQLYNSADDYARLATALLAERPAA